MNPDIYERMGEIEDRHWWFRARRRVAEHMLRSLRLPENARILEVGVGCGGNWRMLSRFGRVSGIEPFEPARRIARRKIGVDISEGALPDDLPDNIQEESFDLIALFDVLEHIDDDHTAVAALRRLLTPGGVLMITVPALPSLWSYHDESHHHKRRYTKRALRSLLARSDLAIHRLTFTNFLLLPIVYAVRKASSLIGRTNGDMHVPAPLVNSILCVLTSSERFAIATTGLPIGSSLLAIAARRST